MRLPLLALALVAALFEGCAGVIPWSEWRSGRAIGGLSAEGSFDEEAVARANARRGLSAHIERDGADGPVREVELSTDEESSRREVSGVRLRYRADGSLIGIITDAPGRFDHVTWQQWRRATGMDLAELVGFTADDEPVLEDVSATGHYAVIHPTRDMKQTQLHKWHPIRSVVRVPTASNLSELFPGLEPAEAVWERLEHAARTGAPLGERDLKRISGAMMAATPAYEERLARLEDALLATLPETLERDELLRRLPRVADALVDLRTACLNGPLRTATFGSVDDFNGEPRKDHPVRPALVAAARRLLTQAANGQPELLALVPDRRDKDPNTLGGLLVRLAFASLAAQLQAPPSFARAVEVQARLVFFRSMHLWNWDLEAPIAALTESSALVLQDAEERYGHQPGAALWLGLVHEALANESKQQQRKDDEARFRRGARRLLTAFRAAYVPTEKPGAPLDGMLHRELMRWPSRIAKFGFALPEDRALEYGVTFKDAVVNNTGRSSKLQDFTERVRTGSHVERSVNPQHATWEKAVARARAQLEEGQNRLAHADDVRRQVTSRDVQTVTSRGYREQSDSRGTTATFTESRQRVERSPFVTWETGRGLAAKRTEQARAMIAEAKKELAWLDEHRPTGRRIDERTVSDYTTRKARRTVYSWEARGEITGIFLNPREPETHQANLERSGLAPGGTWEEAQQEFMGALKKAAMPPVDASEGAAFDRLYEDVEASIARAPAADQALLRYLFLPTVETKAQRADGVVTSDPPYPTARVLAQPGFASWTPDGESPADADADADTDTDTDAGAAPVDAAKSGGPQPGADGPDD